MKKLCSRLRTKPGSTFFVRLFFTVSLLACPYGQVAAQAPNGECRKAYTLIWQYRLAEAGVIIQQQATARPKDPFPIYLQSLSRFLKAFITEEKADFEAFKVSEKAGLSRLRDCDPKNPYTLFAEAEIYMHSGLVRLKVGERISGAMSLNAAYSALTACAKKFPSFLPVKKDLLLMQAAVGTVPESYRWMLNILGFSGDLNRSMQAYAVLPHQMEAHSEYSLFTNETRILQAYLTYYLLNKGEAAWSAMQAGTAGYAGSELFAFVRANLAMRLKKTDLALVALEPHTKEAPSVPNIDYLYGAAKLQRGDRDASLYLARFLKNYAGKNFVKDGYLRLAWAFLLRGDTKNYFNSLELVQAYGATTFEDDKAALRESQRKTIPPTSLLRARLYYDGGYYQKAMGALEGVAASSFPDRMDKAEYYYRSGRVLEALSQPDKAIAQYNTVIRDFSTLKVHFAPAACLYIGNIYEHQGDKPKAIAFYRKCLAYKDYTYKDSFDQKANAGLRRLGE